jgi:hypothetical protein
MNLTGGHHVKRTDVHRPSAINPAEYAYVAYDYVGGDADPGTMLALRGQRDLFRRHRERTGGKLSDHAHGGTCFVCGALALHLVIWHHAPTNTYVETGEECAAKIDRGFDAVGFSVFRSSVRDAREAQAGKRKAQAVLSDLGLSGAWELADYVGGERDEQTVRDIVGKLVKYGSLSEKQVAFLRTLLDRIARRPQILAEKAARDAAKADCPTGRVEVEGVVISTKVVDSDFSRFGVLKMLLEHATGYRVWGTVPDAVHIPAGGLKGVTLRVRATVTPSDKDPKFGFFKRPVLLRQPEEGK